MSVTLHTTHGDLKVQVFCRACPETCYNFLALAASGAYDGSPFHRLIPSFMIQGGSPASGGTRDSVSVYGDGGRGGDGAGGDPRSRQFGDEFRPGLRHHERGVLSMANRGPGTNGSQFFITFGAARHLDGRNTVFGQVLDGHDVLDLLEGLEVDAKNRPVARVAIERVTIHANPLADAEGSDGLAARGRRG